MTTATKKGQYFYSVGKRKTAIARVKIFENGNGVATINNMSFKDYFDNLQVENAIAPLTLTDNAKEFDIEVSVVGGGKSAQSDAVRLGISRALLVYNPEYRPSLKPAGYLRRDARVKERKKPGLKGARRAPQFSKR